jgi:hypothetical protein
VKYRRRFVVRAEDWFEPAQPARGVDVHEVFHVDRPIPGYRCVEFYTLLFDLRSTVDELFAAVRPEARRQIRRCMESGEIAYEHFFPCGTDPLERFFAAYDDLAAIKGLPPLDRELVRLYAANGTLDLSLVRKSDGSPLAWHANYRTPERARQLHSIAFFRGDKAERNLVGRAHRYHTWMDILRFKESGTPVFDLGGWYHGKTDDELLKINAFKEEFGGRVVCQFICERGVSLRGKAYVALRNLTGKGAFNAVAGAAPQ